MNRIKDKISTIETYLGEFENIIPSEIKDYKTDLVIKAAVERYIEKIVEALTDLSFLIIKEKKLKLPEDDIHAFKILFENKLIKEKLFINLKHAKGMRNIIAHQYGDLDDNVIFDSLHELIKDSKQFIGEFK